MLDIFLQNITSMTYKSNKNLREILSILPKTEISSLLPRSDMQNECSIEEYNIKSEICKKIFVVSTDLKCFATKRK